MPTQELFGATALVTGASRGLGCAIAVALPPSTARTLPGVGCDPQPARGTAPASWSHPSRAGPPRPDLSPDAFSDGRVDGT